MAEALLTPEDGPAVDAVLATLQRRLALQLPQHSPGFVAHMSRPPQGVAWLAQALAAALQPNNHNRDAGAACTEMELEAIAALGRMVGWPQAVGHLCSGGTVANLEALWVGRERGFAAPVVLVSDQAHYCHGRNAGLLGLRHEVLPSDERGRWDVAALSARLAQGGVGAVIATVGTTAMGAVDPLPALVRLRAEHRFHLQVDAAYGGYHGLADGLSDDVRAAFDALPAADALVIDPHKHGLQPLGCAAVLYLDARVQPLFQHDAPYCYFSDDGPHLGQLGLEGSRSGAAAAALWATLQLLPLVPGGRFARGLSEGLLTARAWHRRLAADPRWQTGAAPDLDIVTWRPVGVAVEALRQAAAAEGLYLGRVRLRDGGDALRAVWMKPVSGDALEACWAALLRAHAVCCC